MSKHGDMLFLDIDLADRVAWSFKNGLLSHAQALHKVVHECGFSEAIARRALAAGPQYYNDAHPPGSAGPAEQIMVEALADGSIKISENKVR